MPLFWTVLIVSLLMLAIGALVFKRLNRSSTPVKAKARNQKLVSYIVIVFLMLIAMAYVPWLLFFIASVLVLLSVMELIRAARLNDKKPWFALILGLPVLYGFTKFINTPQPEMHLFVYFIVINFDGYSQVLGETFGKRKLVPRISPGKTIEGLVGGILVGLLLGALMIPFFHTGGTWYQIIGFTILVMLFAFTGDILASAYKRYCGIKDYSNLIPGHGGVLDRFDSFFMAGAMMHILQWLSQK